MTPMTWTGAAGPYLNPALAVALVVWLCCLLAQGLTGLRSRAANQQPPGPAKAQPRLRRATAFAAGTVGVLLCAYVLTGLVLPPAQAGIIPAVLRRFGPVIGVLIALTSASWFFRRKLGLYGQLFDSPVGIIGFVLVMFWVITALLSSVFGLIVTHDPLQAISGLKNAAPGTALPAPGSYPYFLMGGDNLARDVFSRLVAGSVIVIAIAPLATLFSFMIGLTLGLPAGYFGGLIDQVLTFLANLILAFPVILLFYLLVTPDIVASGTPQIMAAVLFIFPLIFVGVLLNARYHTRPGLRTGLLTATLLPMGWVYLTLISTPGTRIALLPAGLDAFDIDPGLLVVFVSVVFVNAPTVFRIVRGLTLDLRTRDFVAAAQTRGEGAWYIMLWEILPNARGPLIVDLCLRIGYTTILLGTLGFFGLGLPPESPDWGSTINEGRKLLLIYIHPAVPPALALLSLVLGLNLLADGLREQALRD